MKRTLTLSVAALAFVFAGHMLSAQQQFGGAQLNVPEIPFDSVPNFLKLPDKLYLGEVPGIATNSKGHVFLYTRTGTTTATLGRREKVDFSIPIYLDAAAIMSRRSVAGQLSDLQGKRVAVARGTTTLGAVERGLDAWRVEIVEHITVPPIVRQVAVIRIKYGVRQSAGGSHDGHHPVFQADQLGQSARFKQARHEDHFGAGINQVR
jgi:hypothetical protein